MRALLIVNPNATSTTQAARDLVAHALESRMQLTVAHTMRRGHAAELAGWAATNGMDLIVVHGGDGTINEAINGFLPRPDDPGGYVRPDGLPRLAVLPGGSANVFARSLGIAPDPVEATNQLIDLIGKGTRRRIGLGFAAGTAPDETAESPSAGEPTEDGPDPDSPAALGTARWFGFNAGLGLDARVCAAVDDSRGRGRTATPTRYVRTTLREFFRNKRNEPTLTVEVPGTDPVGDVHYAFVSNSSPWTFMDAKPVSTNPGTNFDTGLGVFAMRSTGVLATLRVASQLLREGAQPKSRILFRVDDVPCVTIRSSEPIAFQLDGDYVGVRNEVRFTSIPNALEVVVPARSTSA
ncbi:diacylglycerol/lipid kinase family protein [Aldersonia kunmingensis]|uniref:diacylglycerol/lipid kinase family protein n=1 Tax=Aldersonia kunmingensis TaxID=408066 RepID=UPI00082E99D6|nr:diacylglycerol kinase family protein [Aldersonia kunmingensis]